MGFRLTWPGVAAIGFAAFAIRLLYVLVIARAPVGVGGDAGFYHSAANLIANGHFYSREIFGHAYKTAEHPPLFSMVLSLSSLLGGDSLLAHRIAGCAIGNCAVVLIALLGRRIGGDRVGLLAGLLAAVYPPLITADGLVMSEPLFVLLVAAALLLALHALSHPSVGVAVALGAVIGLAILTRGEGLLLVPLLLWPAAYARGARRSARLAPAGLAPAGLAPARLAPVSGRLARIAAATAIVALVLAPWVIRNALVFHRFVIAADSSTVIAGANCRETYYGHDIGWWSNACLERARTRAQLLEGGASTSAATRFARHHIARLPLVAAVRVLRTFNFFQPMRQGNGELRRRWVDLVGLVIYFPLFVFAILGAIRLPARRWVLLAPVWMVLVVSVAGWGIGRFRVAADVSLIVLAAYYVVGRSRDRPRRRSTIAAIPAR